MTKEFPLLIKIVISILIIGLAFVGGLLIGRRQIKDWDITQKHRVLEMDTNYIYCPYCGERLQEVEE